VLDHLEPTALVVQFFREALADADELLSRDRVDALILSRAGQTGPRIGCVATVSHLTTSA
jgi:hypothetical protein